MRLFDINSYIKEFTTTVISLKEKKGMYLIELEDTAFFPEGGGQKSDTGTLNNIEVFCVQEIDNKIYHFTHTPIEVGAMVKGVINWDERFYKMQNHTAEHIISGLVFKKFGYDNVGFHLGDNIVTMDYNGPITQEEIEEIEFLANKKSAEAREIKAWYPENPEDYTYRSKLDLKENVRLVEIEGIDLCACCAPHVKNTSEVGLIKIMAMQKYKGGVHIELKSGLFAFETLNTYHKTLKKLSALLSLPPENTFEGVEKLMAKINDLQHENTGLKLEILKNTLKTAESPIVFVDSPDLLKDAVNLLNEKFPRFSAAFAGNDTEGYRFMILTENFSKTKEFLREKLNASGGGRDNMLQGKINSTKNLIFNEINKNLLLTNIFGL